MLTAPNITTIDSFIKHTIAASFNSIDTVFQSVITFFECQIKLEFGAENRGKFGGHIEIEESKSMGQIKRREGLVLLWCW
ncbi:MAG: hypothetical protein K0S30_2070 [Clostridia bacterium]|jgi:hypothetical protein|nr:hypothetical protein [Clostridia bacterium]